MRRDLRKKRFKIFQKGSLPDVELPARIRQDVVRD